MNGQMLLFPQENELDSLELVQMKFVKKTFATWKELFEGFDTLYAITFSYNLDFIEKVMHHFKHAEVILGCEALVKFDLQTIMAHQTRSLEAITKYPYLLQRVEDDSLHFWVAKDIVSHKKVFILKAEDGRTRVIMGSANFSTRSFNGTQLENIGYFEDDLEAFSYYFEDFLTIKEFSTNEIVKEALFQDLSNPEIAFEEIPIVKEAKVKEAGIIIEEGKSNPEELDYVYDISNLSKEYSALIPKKEKDGKILLNPVKTTKMISKRKKQLYEERERRKQYPQFVIDYDKGTFKRNNRPYPLEPNPELVKRDILTMNEYFQGFDAFEGNAKELKEKYFEMANYMLLSPFIANLRYHAFLNDFPVRVFPLYAILCGKSDAGKSVFIATIQTLMLGKSLGGISPNAFTKTGIYGLLREAQGVPLHIEDISHTQFQEHCGKIVKYDEDLLQEKRINHPTIILSSNELKTIKPEFSKRIIVNYIEGNLPKLAATSNHKKLSELRKQLTTNFYQEYLRRMYPAVLKLISEMDHSDEQHYDWIPDVFKLSSEIIIDIIQDNGIELPSYISAKCYDDYFGNKALGTRVYKKIREEWIHNKSAFHIARRQNKLTYQPGEKKFEAEWVRNELPVELRAECYGAKVVMELDKAEEFFELKFRKSIFERN